MFKDFFHKITVSVKEETGRIRSVMHEQLDISMLDSDNDKGSQK